jgi:ribonuclease VapC
MVLASRMGTGAGAAIGALLERVNAEWIPLEREHYNAALSAFLRYGKGRHAASLNFGDCLAYAIASVAGMPLLFVGADFRKTDITAA